MENNVYTHGAVILRSRCDLPFENYFDQHSIPLTGWRGVLFDDHVEGVHHHLLCLLVTSS